MISVHEGGVCHLFPPSTPIFFSTLQRLHQQHWRRHLDRDQVASKELKMYGSPWSAPAWMKSNNALNGQVILFSLNGQVIAFSIIELLSDTIMDLSYVSNRVTFFQSITNNGLTIMSSEKRSLTRVLAFIVIIAFILIIIWLNISTIFITLCVVQEPFRLQSTQSLFKTLANHQHQNHHHTFYVRFLNAYAELGVDMWGLTAQNEPVRFLTFEYGFQLWSFVDYSSNRWTVKLMGLLSTAWAGTQVLRSELVMVCCSWAFELCIIATFQNVNEIFCFCNSVTTCTQGNLDRGVPGTNSRGKC